MASDSRLQLVRSRTKLFSLRAPEKSEDEWMDWYRLTPLERWRESEKLWAFFLSIGGSLDPEPDSESPFYDDQTPSPRPVDGRTVLRILRRGGI